MLQVSPPQLLGMLGPVLAALQSPTPLHWAVLGGCWSLRLAQGVHPSSHAHVLRPEDAAQVTSHQTAHQVALPGGGWLVAIRGTRADVQPTYIHRGSKTLD